MEPFEINGFIVTFPRVQVGVSRDDGLPMPQTVVAEIVQAVMVYFEPGLPLKVDIGACNYVSGYGFELESDKSQRGDDLSIVSLLHGSYWKTADAEGGGDALAAPITVVFRELPKPVPAVQDPGEIGKVYGAN